MNENPAYLVYQHAERFFKSRGVSAKPEAFGVPRNKFIAELDLLGYFKLGSDDNKILLIILAPGSKYTEHGPDLRSLISMFSTTSTKIAEEIIIMAPEQTLAKKNVNSIVLEFRELGNGTQYNMYPFYVLSLDIPRTKSVPKHSIVPPKEVKAILKYLRVAPRNLPALKSSDPPVVWIGGRAGQVVKTETPSSTSGVQIDYWLVK